jgi:hypothetical protein
MLGEVVGGAGPATALGWMKFHDFPSSFAAGQDSIISMNVGSLVSEISIKTDTAGDPFMFPNSFQFMLLSQALMNTPSMWATTYNGAGTSFYYFFHGNNVFTSSQATNRFNNTNLIIDVKSVGFPGASIAHQDYYFIQNQLTTEQLTGLYNAGVT